MSARSIFLFFVPNGLLFAALIWLTEGHGVDLSIPAIATVYPVAVVVTGAVLGWRFNRSRLVFSLLVLVLAERVLAFGEHLGLGAVAWDAVVGTLVLLVPINLVVALVSRERGIFNQWGILRLAAIIGQPVVGSLLFRHYPEKYGVWLHYSVVELPADIARLGPQVAIVATGCCLAVFLFGAIRNENALAGGFFWCTLLVWYGVRSGEDPLLARVFFSTGGLTLVIAILESAHAMAFRDELTGLPGRRALNDYLLKMGRRYTVAMLDVDFFKKFNDTYGHDVGDQVLRMVAGVMAKVRGGGRAFRYGGEEFTVVFAGKAVDDALPYLEEVRQKVEDAGFTLRDAQRPPRKPKNKRTDLRGKRVSVTISIGAAEKNRQYNTPELVMKTADKALYRAKQGGRNRVST